MVRGGDHGDRKGRRYGGGGQSDGAAMAGARNRWKKKKREEDEGRNVQSGKITKRQGKVWQIINCNEHNGIL